MINMRSTPFDEWWESKGKFFDPDTSDVPWFDKRKDLAEYAFRAGWQGVNDKDATQEIADMLGAPLSQVHKLDWKP